MRTDVSRLGRFLLFAGCLASGVVMRAPVDGFGRYTPNRTVQDDIIGQIEDSRKPHKTVNFAPTSPYNADWYQAEVARINRQQALREAEAREQQARDLHAAAERVVEEHWRKVEAGDPQALYDQAEKSLRDGSRQGAVDYFLRVGGPKRVDAWKRVMDLVRDDGAYLLVNKSVTLLDIETYLAEQGEPHGARLAGDEYIKSEATLLRGVRYYAICARAGDSPSRHALVYYWATRAVDSIDVPPAEFLPWCQKFAEQGEWAAQVALAQHLYFGIGTAVDLPGALGWYAKAIATDPATLDRRCRVLWGECARRFALRQLRGDGVAKDVPAAMKWLEQAAGQGDATAEYNLGAIAKEGLNGPADLVAALKWWETAARHGSVLAMHALISEYNSPAGPRFDELKAMEWTRYAADFDPAILLQLGRAQFQGDGAYAKNEAVGHELLEKAWKLYSDDAFVRWQIGAMKLTGLCGFKADPAEGLGLVRSAYEAGQIQASRTLQKAYQRGLGVVANAAEAEKWRGIADASDAPVFTD